MAFTKKFGCLFKQVITSNPSLYQAVRCMSYSKLFVGGISHNLDQQSLRDAFACHGNVVEAKILMDRDTGSSRGFGFVTYNSSEEASAAINAMDGKVLYGRTIRVNYATDRTGGFVPNNNKNNNNNYYSNTNLYALGDGGDIADIYGVESSKAGSGEEGDAGSGDTGGGFFNSGGHNFDIGCGDC